MGYIYKLNLTEPEKHARRAALDRAGYTVVASQLVLLAALVAYRRFGRRGKLQRLEWRLREPISLQYPQLRNLGAWTAVGLWIVWCLVLAVAGTGDDYLHVTKALATVATANLPLHFLLASKRGVLRALGVSYEGPANFAHRWLGRIMFWMLVGHASCYVRFFWDLGFMRTRFLEFDILCGVAALTTLFTIAGSGFHLVRAWSYRLFYLLHIFLVPLLFPLLWLHVSHIHPYLYVSLAIYAADYLARLYFRTPATAALRNIAPGLLEISIQPSSSRKLPIAQPGSHVFVTVPSISRWTANPFTPTSAISTSTTSIRMIARVRSNFTRTLSAHGLSLLPPASPTISPRDMTPVLINGPYGTSLPQLESFDKVLFIAGGVGATFAVSWIKALGALTTPGQIGFVWAVKSAEEALWAFEDDHPRDNAEFVAEYVELYVTGRRGVAEDDEEGVEADEEGAVEMTAGLLNGEGGGGGGGGYEALEKAGVSKERVYSGRPPLKSLIEKTVGEAGPTGSTAVLVCGPQIMGAISKRVVAGFGKKGKDVWIHVEEFGH